MGGLPVKPKLQGYVAQELFNEFERFRATHNLNQSKGLEKLLNEYFGKPRASTLPPVEIDSALPLVAALRSELMELKLELNQRLQLLEDRLAVSSAYNSVTPLGGLAEALPNGLAEVSADESVGSVTELINVLIADDAANTPVEPVVSAANLEDESALAEDAIAVLINVSADSSVDGLATPLDESVDSSAANLKDESAVEEEAAVETANTDEPEEVAVSSLPVAISESPTSYDKQELGRMLKAGWADLTATASEPAVEKTTNPLKPLTSLGLEKRLKRDDATISRNKSKGAEHFKKWSKGVDPDGVAWEFRKGKARSPQFHPLV